MHALDRPLLPGLLAFERQFVTADELLAAFQIWRNQPHGSLGQILASQGKLSADRVESLEKLIADSSLLCIPASSELDASPTSTWRPEATSIASGLEATPQPSEGADSVTSVGGGASARFKPIQLHARGGLGHVFLAEDLELHRQVALKEIRSDAADEPESRERFLSEAKITGNLEHPGIVPVYGLGVHADGRPFYAMRFIQGETFADAIRKLHKNRQEDFASLPFRQLLGRLVDVCNAVAFAHSRGIVHRDLKPQNVMLGPFGETLVVDWGLAKPFKPSSEETTLQWMSNWPRPKIPTDSHYETCEGEIVGTPAYMSPEQAEGRSDSVGPLSDVYGLGAILYALLTGQSPLGGNASDIVEAVKQGQIVPVRKVNPRVPRSLAAICHKAMAHQTAERYQSALDMGADIERWLADERLQAYAEPWSDTLFRWVRKHRLPVAVASVLLLVTSTALAIGFTLVRKERDIARRERASAVASGELARKNAAATRKVIEEYLLRVGDDRLANLPGVEGLRIEMANLAVDRYRELLKQDPDDLSLVGDAGMALRRAANLYRMVGQYSKAESLYAESIADLTQATKEPPRSATYEQWLCDTLCDRALLVARINGPGAALDSMREALAASRQVEGGQPTSPAARQTRARIEADLADLLAGVGRFDEAVRLAQSAATTFQKAADDNRRSTNSRVSAALSGVNLGQTLREAGRSVDAESALNSALERINGYLKLSPSDANMRYLQARCKHEIALVHAASGKLDETKDELREASESLTKLTEGFSTVLSFRRKLAEVLTDSAKLHFAGGETELPRDQVRQAIELLEQLAAQRDELAANQYQSYLASAYLLAGEIEHKRGAAAAAARYLGQAREKHDAARAFNPEDPKLADRSSRLSALTAAITP